MALPTSLRIALKEWDVVCRALETGRQIILLRKGGISELGGRFEVEHRQFLMFSTFLHQSRDMLKPEAHDELGAHSAEPAMITLRIAAEVTDIVALADRRQMDALDAEHIWTPVLINARFNYKPRNPLYLLLVRAYRLVEPVTIPNTAAYAGCKSWVPLEQSIDVTGARPVVDEQTYQSRKLRILNQTGLCSGPAEQPI